MPASEPGMRLGHYRIVRLLGQGGMGQVYLARDLTLERDVAVKVLSISGGDPDDTRQRLLREAQAAAALDHPNICAVYEVGEAEDGRAFIAMQYVEGETLATMLGRGALPVREALTLAIRIADALAAAHRRGIVHRDLKPQNIIVTSSGQPKLLDFGLAKAVTNSAAAADAPTRSIDTFAGMIKGTPTYMAPEQIQQRPIDGRTDLFALGAVLFECLTGSRAFEGTNALEVFGQILHVHPPAASSLRPELTERHDELCRRLLAKHPADRFQSADEVTGALRLLTSDSSREPAPTGVTSGVTRGVTPTSSTPASGTVGGAGEVVPRRRRWPVLAGIALSVIALAVAGPPLWRAMRALPPAPPDAERWYQRGAQAIREGAYYSGQLALQEAIRVFPQYPIAYARLAEALAEQDDGSGAQAQLVRLSSVLPDESRLQPDDRLRLQGTRALVLRDLDASVAAYKQLRDRNPKDATSWLDLGRAQESAGQLPDASASFSKAVALDPQFAAARLRLGVVYAQQSRRKEALAAFAEAERLHHAAANTEGETEVLLRRGAFNDSIGEWKTARADLERALGLATTLKSASQLVRARLSLSSVTAADGRFADSEKLAQEAVQQALDAGLDTVAADGLVDLAASLLESGRRAEAAAKAQRAIDLAERRDARRTLARSRLQLAAIRLAERRPPEAVALAQQALAFLRPNKYRRLELTGLTVLSRAYTQLNDLERARENLTQVVDSASALGNEAQTCTALTGLASVAMALGQLPQALTNRELAEKIRRRLNDASGLPYDLTNRAEILILLGRHDEASGVLDELDAGIRAGNDTYVGRKRRAAMLRGLSAVTMLRAADAVRYLGATQPAGTDQTSVMANALLRYAQARLRRSASAPQEPAADDAALAPSTLRERQFWRAAAALQEGNAALARTEAERGLQLLGEMPNDELRWRLAAVGALAMKSLGEPDRATEMAGRAVQALARLRASWSAGIESYERRPDLAELIARLGSTSPVKGG
jgi:tetratricopeptide (TPR) repeat protein/predicted Ser/Thr protein kinase